MRVFGMISTAPSTPYTELALQSFLRTTPRDSQDRFLLIDNDGCIGAVPEWVELIVNDHPQGFASNMNVVLAAALREGADAFLLNNDLVFTTGWINPLLTADPIILTPFTNREVSYACSVHVTTTGAVPDVFVPRSGMSLDEYRGHEGALEAIAQAHARSGGGYLPVLAAPFCCVKIPYAVLAQVGFLDEDFGKGGGEDYDYSLRAHLLGFKTAYALGSYVLHFGGKSSWSGVESPEVQQERERVFFEHFRSKWGERLFQYVLREQTDAVSEVADLVATADEAVLIRSLMSEPSFPLRIDLHPR